MTYDELIELCRAEDGARNPLIGALDLIIRPAPNELIICTTDPMVDQADVRIRIDSDDSMFVQMRDSAYSDGTFFGREWVGGKYFAADDFDSLVDYVYSW